jgi:hypothetical protein
MIHWISTGLFATGIVLGAYGAFRFRRVMRRMEKLEKEKSD